MQGWYPVSMTLTNQFTNQFDFCPSTPYEIPFANREISRCSGNRDYMHEIAEAWKPLQPTAVFATYWYFAAARQQMFYRRLFGQAPPWSADPILENHRFTNAYRASDRVSQYLIRQVLTPEEGESSYDIRDILFRVLLFKLFNRVETWQMLEHSLGEVSWQSYSYDHYDMLLTQALEHGTRIFSAAYIMPSGVSAYGNSRKHRNCLRLLEDIISDGVAEQVCACSSLGEVFLLLRSYPLLGDFLAFQFAIDINYSSLTEFEESTFVVAGPGARDGIAKCFSNAEESSLDDIIRRMAEHQEEEFERLGLAFQSLWGRPLQLIDCQNLFCEVGKYARIAHPEVVGVSGRTRIKQAYSREEPRPLPIPYYPPKWGINNKIVASLPPHTLIKM